MHHSAEGGDEAQDQQMVTFYNSTKVSVDPLNQISTYLVILH